MKIAIPTYNRSDRFETLSFLKKNNIPVEDIYIFFANEEEKQKYINSFGSEYNWIVGVIGIDKQRNFITNYFDENEILICMDDDIEDLIHKDDKPFLDWINECIDYINDKQLGLLSIPPSTNPFWFNEKIKSKSHKSFKYGNYLAVGVFHIYKNHKDLLINIPFIDDYERSILYYKKYGNNARYFDVLIKTKYWGTGGLSNDRTMYSYIGSVNKFLYRHPEYVSFNTKFIRNISKFQKLPNIIPNKVIKDKVDVIELPKIEPDELSILYGMLEDIYITRRGIKSNRRGFPLGHQSITFGYVRGRYNGKYDLSVYTKKYPYIYQELLRIGNIFCPFEFSAIHINKNVICPPHKDSKNIGKSMLLSFGDYTGCNIVIDGKKYDANCSPLIFDGSELEHYNTDDLTGTKYSLIFYSVSEGNKK